MSVAIRIENDLYEKAQKVAKAEFRTVPLQVQYWAKIGKAALDNPDLPIEFIKDILDSECEEPQPFVLRRDRK